MNNVFSNSFSHVKNKGNSAAQPQNLNDNGEHEQEHTPNNTVNDTVNPPKTDPKRPRNVSDQGTQILLEKILQPRQNSRESEQPNFQRVEDPPSGNYDREVEDEDFILDDDIEEPYIINDDEEEGFEIDDTVIEIFVSMAVDNINLYLPMFIRYLNEVEDPDKFEANEKELAHITKYAVLYAKENKNIVLNLTPGQRLLVTLGTVYGVGIFKGLIHRMPNILNHFTGRSSQAKPRQPLRRTANYYTCGLSGCDEMIEEGKGFPATSKHPHLIDKFCCKAHFLKYSNESGIIGKGK